MGRTADDLGNYGGRGVARTGNEEPRRARESIRSEKCLCGVSIVLDRKRNFSSSAHLLVFAAVATAVLGPR